MQQASGQKRGTQRRAPWGSLWALPPRQRLVHHELPSWVLDLSCGGLRAVIEERVERGEGPGGRIGARSARFRCGGARRGPAAVAGAREAALFAIGTTFIAVGPTASIVGIGLIVGGTLGWSCTPSNPGWLYLGPGIASLVVGVALVSIGVPLFIAGNRMVMPGKPATAAGPEIGAHPTRAIPLVACP